MPRFLLGLSVAWGASIPPTFKVDLDLPPEKRWEGALDVVLNQHPFEYGFKPTFEAHNDTLFKNLKPEQYTRVADAVRRNYPEHAAELQSLSAEFARLGHAVSYEYLAVWAYFHELAHTDLMTSTGSDKECTSILAKTWTGKVLHGGNMDQAPEAVRNVTLHMIFMRGGEVLFQGVDWYWFNAGVTRAVRRGVASCQENWRRAGTIPHEDVLQDIDRGVTSHVWVFRQLLTSPPSGFENVVSHLQSVRIAAPFYITVGGPNGTGAIITRDNTKALNVARIDDKSGPKDWFLVQTNYDRWLPDDAKDPRRTVGERTMQGFGQAKGASMLSLFAATSTYPVHNPHTAYTALMDPETGELDAYVREASCPEHVEEVKDGRYCMSSAVAGSSQADPVLV